MYFKVFYFTFCFFSEIFRFSIILRGVSLGAPISPTVYGVNRILGGAAISELHIV